MEKDEKEEKICINCGKKIAPGAGYQKLGKFYCCEKCCKIGKKRENICEFC